ncbi:MAG: phage gp6-like head-tail connector protein [Proteobacteria bacterium]|nr:phage gp6-like head-tail connector protein [Pseudomonadota bacterium]
MLTLEEVKLHCRIDGYEEDYLLAAMIEAAVASVGDYINATEPLTDTAPAPVKAAAMLLVADLYSNREALVERPLSKNPTFERLLNPYRVSVL